MFVTPLYLYLQAKSVVSELKVCRTIICSYLDAAPAYREHILSLSNVRTEGRGPQLLLLEYSLRPDKNKNIQATFTVKQTMEDLDNPNEFVDRLDLERQLVREERFIIQELDALTTVRCELEMERMDLLCSLNDILSADRLHHAHNRAEVRAQVDAEVRAQVQEEMSAQIAIQTANSSTEVPPPTNGAASSLLDEFLLGCLDNIVNNDVELNLSVPSDTLHNCMPQEENEEVNAEDGDELGMGMPKAGDKAVE